MDYSTINFEDLVSKDDCLLSPTALINNESVREIATPDNNDDDDNVDNDDDGDDNDDDFLVHFIEQH